MQRHVRTHRDLLAGETLAVELSVNPDLDTLEAGVDGVTEVVVGERHAARLRVTRR